jgi:hypothetical protein
MSILYQTYLLNFATRPQGVRSGELDLVRPPWGWSTGFFATPRTVGLNPFFIFRPALPTSMPLGSGLEFLPNITYELSIIILYLFEGILTVQ